MTTGAENKTQALGTKGKLWESPDDVTERACVKCGKMELILIDGLCVLCAPDDDEGVQ